MKTAVVYYSKNGSTRRIAALLAQKLDADVVEIKSRRSFPFPAIRPKLENKSFDFSGYDTVVLGTPVWAGSFAAPIKTFLGMANLSGKRIFPFACSAGGNAARTFSGLKKALAANNVVFEGVSFTQPGNLSDADLAVRVDDMAGAIRAE